MEIWRDIKDYEGYYQVSNYGNVRRIGGKRKGEYYLWDNPKEVKKHVTNTNGCFCSLSLNSITTHFLVNRLVYYHFIGEVNRNEIVHHNDEDITNNNVSNLYKKEFKGYSTIYKKYNQ